MYFPYFRGRQYELLALNELAHKRLISNLILPVVEPIKVSSTLNNTLKIFNTNNLGISIVFNPKVGDLLGEINKVEAICKKFKKNQLVPALLMSKPALSYLTNMTNYNHNDILIILTDRDFLEDYKEAFKDLSPLYTLIPDDRQFKRSVTNRVLFENKFNKKLKNSDYPEDEFFSDDHLFYEDEGYAGFGDYSIVGDEYNESGFAPYAVAIHIVYFDKDKTLRLGHFISNSNFDTSDVAGKFYEAVTKLYRWTETLHPSQHTEGLNTLLNHYNNKTYPGLPTLKKLSIMHHLELINRYLNGTINNE
ncbi:MAG: sce7725 family protein [Sphingobacteriaceae bacterium]|nr:sce7725 family protein [Sphingobacteriaceae bacterium]